MFDFHIHSSVSYDGRASGLEMAKAAQRAGLTEICFTDHLDYDPLPNSKKLTFETEAYNREYDTLQIPGLKVCHGFEFGMLPDNQQTLRQDLKRREFDFVLGSVHFVKDLDVYFTPYWTKWTYETGVRLFLEETLACVRAHDDFDVLAHLTYVAKARGNPVKKPILYHEHREILDEILRILAEKGKGLEVNTSGMDRCGEYLPSLDYLKRFRELGGEIVTVGSDAHDAGRVGQYCREVCHMLKDIFGYVCTFEGRKPVFHK